MAKHRSTIIRALQNYEPLQLKYFDPVLRLLEDKYSYDVVISHMFARLELAHREILYYGALVLHKTERKLTYKAIDEFDLTRSNFPKMFKSIYGLSIPQNLSHKIKGAQETRNRILHGKSPQTGAQQKAILEIMDYFSGMCELLEKKSIWIVGSRQGIKGRSSSLSKDTSRWVLMGMGLLAQKLNEQKPLNSPP